MGERSGAAATDERGESDFVASVASYLDQSSASDRARLDVAERLDREHGAELSPDERDRLEEIAQREAR